MDQSVDTASTADGGERKRKRRKLDGEFRSPPPPHWRTDGEQQIYSSKLLEAIRHVRRSSPTSTSAVPHRSRAVREAADRVLAFAARGRTRWSRAILVSSRRAMKLRASRRRPRKPPAPAGIGAQLSQLLRLGEKAKGNGEDAGAPSAVLQRKAKVLGRLVPGCRKLPFPTLLDETSNYIAALQMQVRAMTALAEILSSAGAGAAGEQQQQQPPPPPR